MFGKKRREAERLLLEEQEAHRRTRAELASLKRQLEELRDSRPQRPLGTDDEKRLFDEKQRRLLTELEQDIVHRRTLLTEELAQRRTEAEEELQARLKLFAENYLYYLSQLKLIMDILGEVSLSVGKTFLTDETAGAAALFRARVELGLQAKASPSSFGEMGPGPVSKDCCKGKETESCEDSP